MIQFWDKYVTLNYLMCDQRLCIDFHDILGIVSYKDVSIVFKASCENK